MEFELFLSPAEKNLLRESSKKITSISSEVAEEFFRRLFELERSYEEIFVSDLKVLWAGLQSFLEQAVHHLDDHEKLVPVIQGLSRSHLPIDFKDRHFEAAKTAWLDTIHAKLGVELNYDVRMAWAQGFSVLSDIAREELAQRHLSYLENLE